MKPKRKELRMSVEEWNRCYPPGTPVKYHPIIDHPRGIKTKTRSEAWKFSDGEPVVLVEGKGGIVSLRALDIL